MKTSIDKKEFEKFHTSIPELQILHERKVLGKILKSIRQTKDDLCLPAFKYRLGKDRYEVIYNPGKYYQDNTLKFLRGALYSLKFHSELKIELENFINRVEALK